MKTKLSATITRLCWSVVLAVLTGAVGVQAQFPGAGGPAGMTGAISKLFGDIKNFSAKAEAQVLDSSQKETVKMPMDFEFLDGKIRLGVDMGQMKNTSMPPGTAEQLKQMGMAKVVSIIRPDRNQVYILYPDNKVLMSMPLPKEDDAQVKKTPLGKETVVGHPCDKTKVTITDAKGQNVEATTWNATDLKGFPVQIETREKENTSIIRFSNVQLAKAEAKDFDPPAGYTQYSSPQEMKQGMMSKMQGQKK